MVQLDNKEVKTSPESTVRYQKMLNNFKAMQGIDKYTGNTYIDRKFNDDMEVALQDVEKLFDEFLSAPELKEVGKMISKRLGRKLEAYDICTMASKPAVTSTRLNWMHKRRPFTRMRQLWIKKLPDILMKLGFSAERPTIWPTRSQSMPLVVQAMPGELP